MKTPLPLPPEAGAPVQTVLRPGLPSDLEAMYRLDLVCFEEPFRFDRQTMRQLAFRRRAIVVLAEFANVLAGFIVVNFERIPGGLETYISTIDVHPEWRRRGIAQALLERAERQASAEGARAIGLHVYSGNQPALAFYERLGYLRTVVDAGFYGEGLDAWTYSKPLPDSTPQAR